jgi:outer membrane protein
MRLLSCVLLVTCSCFALSLKEAVKASADSNAIRAQLYLAKAYKKSADAASGRLYPKLDLSYKSLQYSEQPSMYVNMPPLITNSQMQNAPKNYFEGEIVLTYPIFRGFAIDAFVKKAELEAKKAELEKDDSKRNVYAKTISLYYTVASLSESEEAYKAALDWAAESLKKATAMYKEGIIGAYDIENIKSKYFEISSDAIEIKNKKEAAVNMLERLCGLKADSVSPVAVIFEPDKDTVLKEAFEAREDIAAVKTLLEINEQEVRYAKSRFYPTLDLVAVGKRVGDTVRLNGDGFTNKDKNYAMLALGLNIFDGLESYSALEAARAKKMASELMYIDYKNGVKTEIENLFLELLSAKKRVDALTQNVNASSEFYKLTSARFDNRLVGADELSRSISNLAAAKSKLAAEKNRVSELKLRILLESSLKNFENKLEAL